MPRRRTGQEVARAAPGTQDAAYLLRAPRELLDAAKARAQQEGISLAEWWRLAARERLRQGR